MVKKSLFNPTMEADEVSLDEKFELSEYEENESISEGEIEEIPSKEEVSEK